MKHKAFTLLELLVVIGIIGTMMAMATVAYSSTQKSGRDSRRKQDLVAIQNALEQYYGTTGTVAVPKSAYTYPDGACNVAKDLIKGNWPVDPVNDTDTGYIYSGVDTCSSETGYCICAKLESGKGGNTDATATCDFSTAVSKDYYCVGNLQ